MKKIIGLALLVLLVFGIGIPCAQAVTTFVTQEGHLAAKSKQGFEEAMNIEKKGDTRALDSLISSRKAFRLKGGDRVYVEGTETGLVAGRIVKIIKIRYEGELKEVWTINEAVKKVE